MILLVKIAFPNLTRLTGLTRANYNQAIRLSSVRYNTNGVHDVTVSFPELAAMDIGGLHIAMVATRDLDFPKLTTTGFIDITENYGGMRGIKFPALETVTGFINNAFGSVISIDIKNLSVNTSEIKFTNLKTVVGKLSIAQIKSVTEIVMDKLTSCGGIYRLLYRGRQYRKTRKNKPDQSYQCI